jgi:pimeloyl-ACP methyl ester carboxylesterase
VRRLAIAVALLGASVGSGAAAKPRWQQLPMPAAMPSATDHGDVTSDGASIHYAIYGKGDPVVLLHGGLGNSDHWANQVPALAAKFQVIAIDSRGQGRSTRTRAAISYDLMASDVIAVLDELKVERASFVGWSDGGEVALKLAIQHPERVAKLFVLGANYDGSGSKPRGGPPAQTFNAYAQRCRLDYQRMSKTPRAWDAMVDWLRPVWRNPMGFTKDQLRAIQAPTLIADGDHDEIIVLDQIVEMSKLIPNAKLQIFADTSHFAHWQDPDGFNKVLLDFLTP